MKIRAEHFAHIRDAIATLPKGAVQAHIVALSTDPRVKDLEHRLRWDLLRAAVKPQWVCDNIYPYANDEHLDTALRAAIRELKEDGTL